MSFVKDALFGSKGTPSQVINTTPAAFQSLAGPLAGQLMQQLSNPARYNGPYAAQMQPGETQALTNVNAAAQQAGMLGPGQQMLMGSTGFNPFAQLSGLEQFGLGQVANQAFAPSAAASMFPAIQQQAFGQNPLSTAVNQQLQSIVGGNNPLTQQLITMAQRPILDNFSDQALQERGLFTAAGQQVQGRGSSPFAQASARLAGNTQNALNEAALGVTNQAFGQQIQGLQLGQNQQSLQLQNMIAALTAGDQMQNSALTRALTGMDAAGVGQQRQGAAFENQQNRQQGAGAAVGQQQLAGQMAQLEAQLANLQAQGLPRMIEQLGIEGGLAQFQNQQTQLLQLMQLMGGLSSPNAAVLPGTSGTPGALQGFAQGFGGIMGQMLGSKVLW